MVVHCCLDYLEFTGGSAARTVTMSRLATDESSPGKAFRIGSADLETSIRSCQALFDGDVQVVESIGTTQMVIYEEPGLLAERALELLYGQPAIGRAP